MATQQVADAFNAHLNKELYASYLYLSMAAYCQSINLPGFAHWLRTQSQEEMSHAMKFFDHLDDRRARVKLTAIQEPPAEFDSPQRLFEQVLAHERGVTKEIVLDVADISPAVPDGRGGEKMGATASAKINRKDWGIHYHKVLDTGGLNVADEVTIEIEAELARAAEPPKSSGE